MSVLESRIQEIHNRLHRKELSVSELVETGLKRIGEVDGRVKAFLTVDEEGARKAAAELDRKLGDGAEKGLLFGLPAGIKDNIVTRGLRTTCASRLLDNYRPIHNATVVDKLEKAQSVTLGKLNMDEFAMGGSNENSAYFPTRNPWNLEHVPGGSSGGSGAAVAARFAPLAIGTDFGGSVRIPASFNGIVGIRPAPGRVPFYPTDFGWDTLVPHVVGPMARNVRDAALVLDAMSGADPRDPMSLIDKNPRLALSATAPISLQGRRIAFCPDLGGLAVVNEEVEALARRAAFSFESLGCHVEEACFDASDLLEIIAGTRSFGLVARYAQHYEKHKDLMTTVLKNQIEAALQMDLPTMLRAEKLRTLYWRRLAAFMDSYDYIITPTCAAPPFSLDEPMRAPAGGPPPSRLHDVALLTYAFSVVGLPVVALPCGLTRTGLPVGIQLAARRQREDLAIEAGHAYETAHPGHFRQPDLLA